MDRLLLTNGGNAGQRTTADLDRGQACPSLTLEEMNHRCVLGRRIRHDPPDAMMQQNIGTTAQEQTPKTTSAPLRHHSDVVDRALVETVASTPGEDDGEHEP